MFEEFYGMYGPKEQEVVALIKRCIGGGYHNKGDFWGMTVVTLGMVFCDTGKASPKEERLEWPVTNEERDGERGWGRFRNEQICRLKIRRIKEEWAQNLVARPWCISEVVRAHEDCPELQAILDEYHKPVVIQDEVLGELTLDKDYDAFEGEIQWCGKVYAFLWRSMLRARPHGPAPATPPRGWLQIRKPGTRPCGTLRPKT